MQSLFEFIDQSVSPFHSVSSAESMLVEQGFCSLNFMEPWALARGGKYYVTRNGSSIIAFVLPEKIPAYYHLSASHSDSPTFRIKKLKKQKGDYAVAEVEGYGGMIYSTWLDRPLSMAGRVVIKRNHTIETKLIAPDKDLFVIPNLAIHMNREINKGYEYNPQIDLQPLYGGKDASLQNILEKEADLSADEEIIDWDLVLTVRQKAVTAGAEDELYLAPRIDDLASAYATLQGFLQGTETSGDGMALWCMYDNEEVGSGTRQGAQGGFLTDVLSRVEDFYEMSNEQILCAREASLLISADNAHATHPNLPAKTDGEFPVFLNQGIVIKYNASQKYTTTGLTAGVFEEICRRAKVSVQHFANRADAPGGSTLGNLLSHQFSVPMVDIGLPQLAMHSAVETAGMQDVEDMIRTMKMFYQGGTRQTGDGVWQIS